MALFQSKIGWKIMRPRENKNYRSILSLPAAKYQIPKKQQKNSKIKKNTFMASFQAKTGW